MAIKNAYDYIQTLKSETLRNELPTALSLWETGDKTAIESLREQGKQICEPMFQEPRWQAQISNTLSLAKCERGEKYIGTVELIDGDKLLVTKRNAQFVSAIEFYTRANVGDQLQYCEFYGDEDSPDWWVKINGKYITEIDKLFAVKQAGEADWETLERLNLPEEFLLP